MKKTLVIAFLSIFALTFAFVVKAQKPQDEREKFSLPKTAREVAPGVYKLASVKHEGKIVEGYAFVDYKKNHAKPSGCNEDGRCQGWENTSCVDCLGNGSGDEKTDTSSCYGFLAKGAKWKTVEDWVVNASNSSEINKKFVKDNLTSNIAKWEEAAGKDILGGSEATTSALFADTESPDNQNEVYFADIDSPNAIGVTIVWGIFGGPPPFRELIEWDQVYDDTDFAWSEDATGSTTEMDFENIATHELGHSVGLDDLYNSNCSEATMYGYATEGEIKKRTLEAGDVRGVRELYK